MFHEPKIIFHHVPKCAGTSIVTGLALTYYPWRLLRYGRKGFPGALHAPASSKVADLHGKDRYAVRRKLLAYFAEKGDSPLISGHYPFNHKFYDEHHKQWHFITLLRDPLSRWYSEYLWNRYKDHEYRKTDLTIDEYIESEHGLENARSFVNFFSQSEDLTATATQKEVDESVETLEKMDVVGCLEHLDRFKSDMKKVFKRKPIFFARNASPAPKDMQLLPDKNSDTYKKLLNQLQADIEIYTRIKEKLSL